MSGYSAARLLSFFFPFLSGLPCQTGGPKCEQIKGNAGAQVRREDGIRVKGETLGSFAML